MKTYIRIVADTNDADYIETFQSITQKELADIMPMIKAIKAFKPYETKTADGEMDWTHRHNYPDFDRCRNDLGDLSIYDYYVKSGRVTEDQFEAFEDIRPHGEQGVHTIVSVEIIEVANVKELFLHKYED